MSESTNIAWCDSTWNPWIGCTMRYRTSASNWAQPIAWNRKVAISGKRWRVFCNPLCDFFDNEIPDEWRRDLWDLIELTPHLDWLLLTKRIGNAARMLRTHDWAASPRWSVRILIPVRNQVEAERDIPKLLALPCKNGIIYEPDLGPVDFHGMWSKQVERAYIGHYVPGMYRKLQWIIVGGESAQGRRPTRAAYIAWARDAIAQCRAAGVPVFYKQGGASNDLRVQGFPL